MNEQNSEKENTSFEKIENEEHNYLDVDYKVNKPKNFIVSKENKKKALSNRHNFVLVTTLSIMILISLVLLVTEILTPQKNPNQTEQKSTLIVVKVIEENNKAVEGAIVTFPNTKFTIIEETKNKNFNLNKYYSEQPTDSYGSTIIELPNDSDVDISITKPGFKPAVISLKVARTLKNKIIILNATN